MKQKVDFKDKVVHIEMKDCDSKRGRKTREIE